MPVLSVRRCTLCNITPLCYKYMVKDLAYRRSRYRPWTPRLPEVKKWASELPLLPALYAGHARGRAWGSKMTPAPNGSDASFS